MFRQVSKIYIIFAFQFFSFYLFYLMPFRLILVFVISKLITLFNRLLLILSSDAVVVFNLNKPGNISKAIMGEKVGTLIGATWNSTVTRT